MILSIRLMDNCILMYRDEDQYNTLKKPSRDIISVSKQG